MALFGSKKKTAKKTKVTGQRENLAGVIVAPRLTEKAALMGDQNVYTFLVNTKATKPQIKKAIEQIYKVTPRKVNVVTGAPKKVRRRSGIGSTKQYKKAMVFLKKGDAIEIM